MAAARRIRRTRIVGALTCSIISTTFAVLAVAASPARADVVEPPRPAFYEAPATLPAANGAVIRSEKLTYLLDPLDATSLVRNSTRVLYKTTNRAGRPIAVSGTVLVPNGPWIGWGTRPIIGYAAGTQGMADRCAPSRLFSEGIEYEAIGIEGLLARGYAVAMTDYEGLGTAGVHTYMDRVSQGRAVLDMVRAAQRLGVGVNADSPVGLEGYSQGGGAAAAAVELAPTYAPELKIKGAYVGAVPADLAAVAKKLDGSLWSAFGFFALRGLAASYDVDFTPYLNEKGVKAMTDVEQDCVFDLFSNAFVRSETLTRNGESITTLMTHEPFRSIIEGQRIGRIKPQVPVMVTHSALDDTIPYAAGKAMAKSWCGKGANVRFSTNLAPAHIGGMIPHVAGSFGFWEARFAGWRQWSNCWAL